MSGKDSHSCDGRANGNRLFPVIRRGGWLALVPPPITSFNWPMNDIKWLEYSSPGVPAIFSDVLPFRRCIQSGRNGWLLAYEPSTWIRKMVDPVNSPAARAGVAAAAKAEVTRQRSIQAGLYAASAVLQAACRTDGRRSPLARRFIMLQETSESIGDVWNAYVGGRF